MSAIRSGFAPWTADRFGDLDLAACVPAVRVEDYPAGLERAVSDAPQAPWLYTGALENRPDLIERLAKIRRLYGVRGESLRAVRDPFQLSAAIKGAGLAAPRCARLGDPLPRDSSWLCKPLASAGGCGVRRWDADFPRKNSAHARDSYLQQRIDGLPVGAVYVGADRRAEFLGATRQLLGLDWCGLPARPGHEYRYCGSIGPMKLTPALAHRFVQLGNALAEAFDLQGLFGVDAIVADGEIWPVEVNPRYTASVEILERGLGIRSIALHGAACGGKVVSPPSVHGEHATVACCGKAILFAPRDIIVSPEFPAWCADQNKDSHWPAVADMPAGGTILRAGQPIVSVLAEGADEAAVIGKLRSLALLAVDEIADNQYAAADIDRRA